MSHTSTLSAQAIQPRRIGSVAAAALVAVGLMFGSAAPAEAGTKVMSGSSKHYLSCLRAYDSASRHLVNLGYDSQVDNKSCDKRWTWSKGYIYEFKITARN